jgi:hypothetical protein
MINVSFYSHCLFFSIYIVFIINNQLSYNNFSFFEKIYFSLSFIFFLAIEPSPFLPKPPVYVEYNQNDRFSKFSLLPLFEDPTNSVFITSIVWLNKTKLAHKKLLIDDVEENSINNDTGFLFTSLSNGTILLIHLQSTKFSSLSENENEIDDFRIPKILITKTLFNTNGYPISMEIHYSRNSLIVSDRMSGIFEFSLQTLNVELILDVQTQQIAWLQVLYLCFVMYLFMIIFLFICLSP